MPTVEQSVEIALPPKDVWEYIAVAENWPNWENSMVECKQITDGPMGVGSRWHGVSRILGKRLEWTSEFTEYDPPRSSKSTSVESPVSFSQTTTCEEVGDGTRVTYRLDSEKRPGRSIRQDGRPDRHESIFTDGSGKSRELGGHPRARRMI